MANISTAPREALVGGAAPDATDPGTRMNLPLAYAGQREGDYVATLQARRGCSAKPLIAMTKPPRLVWASSSERHDGAGAAYPRRRGAER